MSSSLKRIRLKKSEESCIPVDTGMALEDYTNARAVIGHELSTEISRILGKPEVFGRNGIYFSESRLDPVQIVGLINNVIIPRLIKQEGNLSLCEDYFRMERNGQYTVTVSLNTGPVNTSSNQLAEIKHKYAVLTRYLRRIQALILREKLAAFISILTTVLPISDIAKSIGASIEYRFNIRISTNYLTLMRAPSNSYIHLQSLAWITEFLKYRFGCKNQDILRDFESSDESLPDLGIKTGTNPESVLGSIMVSSPSPDQILSEDRIFKLDGTLFTDDEIAENFRHPVEILLPENIETICKIISTLMKRFRNVTPADIFPTAKA